MLRYAVVLSLTLFVACGGGDDDGNDVADANVTPDAEVLVEELVVVIDGVTVCPGGWTTTEAIAVRETTGNRIRVSAGCTGALDEVLLYFSPLPAGGGGTAPCHQSTMLIDGGARTQCRVGGEGQEDPGGMITIDAPIQGWVQGTCTCIGNNTGGTASAEANILLTL